ncbi:MAG: ferritin family protein [Bacteroidota bacterium]
MQPRELYNRPLFNMLILFPLGMFLSLIGSNFGCQKQKEEVKGIKQKVTIENLQTAYAKSVNYERMYTLFTKRAEKDRLTNVVSLYRAVSRSEGIHANLHAQLLRKNGVEPVVPPEESVPVGTTLQTLKLAASSEEIEYGKMYTNLIHTAELEKDSAAVKQFQMAKDVDAQHLELFKEAVDRAGRIPRVQYYVCGECGYILTSEKTEECPVCHAKKDRFEKI